MKKFLCLLAGASVALSSCSEIGDGSTHTTSRFKRVSFASAVQSRVANNEFVGGDEINVTAYENDAYFGKGSYAYVNGQFTSGSPISYESETAKSLSYVAVYPAETAKTDEDFTYALPKDQSFEYPEFDLLVSHHEATTSLSPTLDFDHTMVQMNVNVTVEFTGDGLTGAESDEISNFKFMALNEALCNATDKSYVGSGSVAAIKPYSYEGEFTAIIAPQTIVANELFAELSVNGTTQEWGFEANKELVSGSSYNYDWEIEIEVEAGGVTTVTNIISAVGGQIGSWGDGDEIVKKPENVASDYAQKSYGEKTWMVEMLNWAGENGDLGAAINDDARGYTWYEAMTGIKGCSADQFATIFADVDLTDPNIQIQGVCPEGWHIANQNDWYDLIVSIKEDYNVPSKVTDMYDYCDGAVAAGGFDVGVSREDFSIGGGFTLGENWGCVSNYLKKSGDWPQGNQSAGGKLYPMYSPEANNVGFNLPLIGYISSDGVTLVDNTKYTNMWLPYSGSAAGKASRITAGTTNTNFSVYAGEDAMKYIPVRCVKNY